jgi:large subunit ribosomal protein L23
MTNDQVILAPLVTEKSTIVTEHSNQVVFRVRREAGKDKIRGAVEELFKVTVVKIRTSNYMGKMRRRGKSVGRQRSWKKAYVTLKDGDKIEFFEGL